MTTVIEYNFDLGGVKVCVKAGKQSITLVGAGATHRAWLMPKPVNSA